MNIEITQESSDEQLYGAFANGNQSAFDLLVNRHTKRLRSLAAYKLRRSLPGRQQYAEDVVQKVFVKAFQSVNTGSRWNPDRSTVKQWLDVMVYSEASSFNRRPARVGLFSDVCNPAMDNSSDHLDAQKSVRKGAEPIQILVAQESEAQTRQCLDQFAPVVRQIVEKTFRDEKSGKQVAEELGISRATVSRRLTKVKGQLRQSVIRGS